MLNTLSFLLIVCQVWTIKSSFNKIGIRSEPAYPGDQQAGYAVGSNEIVRVKDKCTVPHGGHQINFFELMDGRGWIHDYNKVCSSCNS